ncbi:hypothetical protein C8R43DRAFT_959181 [Mycena crocata]|nr:hypothetical protein C8R43DRAFT_959181 [Mycena crocata]
MMWQCILPHSARSGCLRSSRSPKPESQSSAGSRQADTEPPTILTRGHASNVNWRHIKPSYPVFHTEAPAEKTETRGKIEHRASFTESSNRGWSPGIGRQVGQQNLSHDSQALQKWDRGAWGILLSVIALKPKECMDGMDKDSLDRETGLVSEEIATEGVRTFSITTLQYNNQINQPEVDVIYQSYCKSIVAKNIPKEWTWWNQTINITNIPPT